ncbi:potassium channel subfamily K member 9-like [Acropora muricata]|uniref:potassium channel subfamily K member 9-like n=1 Tax=Acropora millepora TaxID=45264 RepID=UPI0010FC79A1|nr:potassium channel subfamily K member 9-like [Acropora millepora]XP_029208928.1 potassium channel subfamily K member 9-like [Acropora millepora]
MKTQNLRTILLTICCVSYLLVGAAIFSALEYDFDQAVHENMTRIRDRLTKKYNISEEDLNLWLKFLDNKANIDADLYQWSFPGSVYFATTVITTIGYGHTVPKTDRGKSFCMLYAAVGIPLALTMFQSIGERLNTFLAHIFRRVKKRFGMKNTEVSNTANMVVLFGLFCMVVTVCSGAFIFSYYEKWSYFQSLYYCFITVTTIGFGDYVALQDAREARFDGTYVGISLLFIFFGLTIVGSVMNQLALRLLTASQAKEPVEQLIHDGPRCDKCSWCRPINDFDSCEPYSDYSTTLLKNFEEEICFTTYKGLHKKRASI